MSTMTVSRCEGAVKCEQQTGSGTGGKACLPALASLFSRKKRILSLDKACIVCLIHPCRTFYCRMAEGGERERKRERQTGRERKTDRWSERPKETENSQSNLDDLLFLLFSTTYHNIHGQWTDMDVDRLGHMNNVKSSIQSIQPGNERNNKMSACPPSFSPPICEKKGTKTSRVRDYPVHHCFIRKKHILL